MITRQVLGSNSLLINSKLMYNLMEVLSLPCSDDRISDEDIWVLQIQYVVVGFQNITLMMEMFWERRRTSHVTNAPLTADLIHNQNILVRYGLRMLGLLAVLWIWGTIIDADISFHQQPQHKSHEHTLKLTSINPFNRKLKIYLSGSDPTLPMDKVKEIQVFGIRGEQQSLKMAIPWEQAQDYQRSIQGELMYYVANLNVLDETIYLVKVIMEQPRQLQSTDANNQKQTSTEEQKQNTQASSQPKQKDKEEQKQKEAQQQKKKQDQERQKKRKQQKKKEEEQRIRQKKKEEQMRRKQKQQNRKANIKILVRVSRHFTTIMQFVMDYLFLLVIIYVVADNPSAPRILGAILVLSANPLIFIHLSFPNAFTHFLDTVCQSGSYLYLLLWVYFVHERSEETKRRIWLCSKLGLALLVYGLNVFRLLHFPIDFLEKVVVMGVFILLGRDFWSMVIRWKVQEHRSKILLQLSLSYLFLGIVIWGISNGWMIMMTTMISQIYGIHLVILLGRQKIKTKPWPEEMLEIKEESDREVMKVENSDPTQPINISL